MTKQSPPPPGDSDTSRAAALVKRSPTLAVALATLILAAPLALHAQTQCTLQHARLSQAFPSPSNPLNENSTFIFNVSFPNTCQARTKPLTVCVDVWDTTACPPGTNPSECDGRIRGSAGNLATGGWVRDRGPRICNSDFLTLDIVNQVQTSLSGLIQIFDDDTKADRQNHLIVVMYDPFFQMLRVPIIDND